jgi:hypothetical protein
MFSSGERTRPRVLISAPSPKFFPIQNKFAIAWARSPTPEARARAR